MHILFPIPLLSMDTLVSHLLLLFPVSPQSGWAAGEPGSSAFMAKICTCDHVQGDSNIRRGRSREGREMAEIRPQELVSTNGGLGASYVPAPVRR